MYGYGNSMFLATHGILARSASTPAFTGLLDTYSGASAAYSLRRLSSTYTGNLIRVRRSSDNTEQDISYDSNNVLDETALLAFVGVGSASITTWYDQSGNSRNVTQPTAASQPLIVSSGTILTMSGTGASKPRISFDASNDFLGRVAFTTTYPLTVFSTLLASSTTGNRAVWTNSNTTTDDNSIGAGSDGIQAFAFKYPATFIEAQTANVYTNGKIGLNTSLFTASNTFNVWGNSTITASGTQTNPSTANQFSIGALIRLTPAYQNVSTNEIIVYPSDQSTNRTAIETNINTYYSIY